jgi:hypothetical protein
MRARRPRQLWQKRQKQNSEQTPSGPIEHAHELPGGSHPSPSSTSLLPQMATIGSVVVVVVSMGVVVLVVSVVLVVNDVVVVTVVLVVMLVLVEDDVLLVVVALVLVVDEVDVVVEDDVVTMLDDVVLVVDEVVPPGFFSDGTQRSDRLRHSPRSVVRSCWAN